MEKIVILGAGITGLALAYKLSKNYKVILIEKQKVPGGMSTSFEHKGFVLDYGPHKLYTQIPGIIQEIQEVVALSRVKKKNSIYLMNNYFDFPISMKQIAMRMPSKAIQASFDIVKKSIVKLPEDSYENFLINRFGNTLYSLVFKSYAEKIWGNPLELDVELAKRRVAVSSIFELIKSVILKDSKKISAEYFFYPLAGIKQLTDSLVSLIIANNGEIVYNTEVKEIVINNNKVVSLKIGKKKIKPAYLISTIPLASLLKNIKDAPLEVLESSKKLSYVDTNVIYFLLNKERALKDNWIFFPEKKILFNRISEQKSFSFYTCPKGKTALMVETTKTVTPELIDAIKKQLFSLKIIKNEEVEEIFVKKMAQAYPLYKKGYKKDLNNTLSYLNSISNLYTLGRQGLFNYNNIDQCWDMARKLSVHIQQNKTKEDWKPILKIFDNYKIVD